MPFAEDYDAAAAALEAAAQATGTLVDPARAAMGTGVMVGGQLTDVVTDELNAADVILDEVSAEMTQLAATCRERAEICRQALSAQQAYDASYADYEAHQRQQDAADGSGPGDAAPEPPAPPPDPPPWANR